MNQQLTIGIDSWTRDEKLALKVLGCAAFAILTALAASVRIPLPLTPVPMTLQTFVVVLAGGVLGTRWGTTSMLLYLMLGIIGIDVFASTPGGIRILIAPTAGYLFGFIAAAALTGFIRDASSNRFLLFAGLLLAQISILIFGAAGLMLNANFSLSESILKGVVPFLAGDVLKIVASFFVLVSYDHFRKVTSL